MRGRVTAILHARGGRTQYRVQVQNAYLFSPVPCQGVGAGLVKYFYVAKIKVTLQI